MNEKELLEKYDQLYDKMATSNKIENMRLFGKVGREAMVLLVKNMPDKANDLIDKLCAVKWDNDLTEREAEEITLKMVPQRPWSKEQWKSVMEQHGCPMDEEPYYNRCAIYTTMCMIYSDNIDTLKKYTSNIDLFDFIHALSLNKLKDKDKVFSIRKYFDV